MTKAPKPGRTNPLDRDGDGNPGGSLPGNKTAPMADATGDDADAELPKVPDTTTPEQQARLDLMEQETDEAKAAHRAELDQNDGWIRNDAEILEDLQLVDEGWSGMTESLTLEIVTGWDEEEAEAAQSWAHAAGTDGNPDRPEAPDFLKPFLNVKDDTFTPDQVAASQPDLGAANAELDAALADGAAPPSGEPTKNEGGVKLNDVQIVARIRELTILVNARRLYKSKDGYSENHGAPYIADTTVQAWIDGGLAEWVPSAGNEGGVKLTAEARRTLTELKHGVAA